MVERIVITIDGPSGAGKSTVSRLLARRLGFTYLDTGAMYRAFALAAEHGKDDFGSYNLASVLKDFRMSLQWKDGKTVIFIDCRDVSDEIRSPYITELASRFSAMEEVRELMVELQRKMAAGVSLVAEGRDMGTVVFPSARVKFFLEADLDERARRRFRELIDRGETVSLDTVRNDIELRDARDTGRSISPLRPAEDAFRIDSSRHSADEVVKIMMSVIEARMADDEL